MKFRLILLAGLLSSSAYAANVSVATEVDGTAVQNDLSRAIFDLDGTAVNFGTGFVGVGYFTSLPTFASTSAAVIESSFNRLGSSFTIGFDYGGGFQADGIFSATPTAPILTGSTNDNFIGKNIFLVLGNGSSIGNSTGLLVLQSSTLFAADNPLFSTALNLQTGTGLTVLHGSNNYNGTSQKLIELGADDGFGAINSYQMAALIPEPSSFLLTALGVFGFILRRRR